MCMVPDRGETRKGIEEVVPHRPRRRGWHTKVDGWRRDEGRGGGGGGAPELCAEGEGMDGWHGWRGGDHPSIPFFPRGTLIRHFCAAKGGPKALFGGIGGTGRRLLPLFELAFWVDSPPIRVDSRVPCKGKIQRLYGWMVG